MNNENENLNNGTDYESLWKHLIFLFIGSFGMSLIATFIQPVINSIIGTNPTDVAKIGGSIALNICTYVITGILLIFLTYNKILKDLIKQFKNKSALIDGVAYGFLLLSATSVLGIIINLLRGETGDVSENERIIRLMIQHYPFPLFIMSGILAPIFEELTYRYGLFGSINRKNRWVAYIVSALVFGLIHFDSSAKGAELINELWNLPSYVLSGAILARAYEKHECISTSIVAHSINNIFAFLVTFINY